MHARNFFHINKIEASVNICRKFAVKKIDNDAAGGGGFHVAGADGGGRVEHHHFLALVGGFERFLLGKELGALVMPDHVGERDGRVLVDDGAVGLESHRRYAGGVDDTPDALFAGDTQQLAGTVYIGGIHLLRIAHPEAIVGGNMEDEVAIAHTGTKRFGL